MVHITAKQEQKHNIWFGKRLTVEISTKQEKKQRLAWRRLTMEMKRMSNNFTLLLLKFNHVSGFYWVTFYHQTMSLNRCPGIIFIIEKDAHQWIMTFDKKVKEN